MVTKALHLRYSNIVSQLHGKARGQLEALVTCHAGGDKIGDITLMQLVVQVGVGE
jgi:hypothetical protein